MKALEFVVRATFPLSFILSLSVPAQAAQMQVAAQYQSVVCVCLSQGEGPEECVCGKGCRESTITVRARNAAGIKSAPMEIPLLSRSLWPGVKFQAVCRMAERLGAVP